MTIRGDLCAVVVALSLVAASSVSAQVAVRSDPSRGSLQERLNRVRTDLFSPSPRLDDDVRELKEILGHDPRLAEGHVLLGIAYRGLGTQEMLAEAVAEFRQGIDIDPNLAPARFFLAHVYMDMGRPARAKEELEAALEKAPGNPQFMASLGEAQRQLNNPRKAVELIRQALQTDPGLLEGHYYLGLALVDLGQTSDAIKELEQVVNANAGRPEAFLALGTVYNQAGRFDAAIQVLSQGTKLDPSRADLRIQLARAYRSKGLLDRAEAELIRAQPKANTQLAASYVEHQQLEFDLHVEVGLVKMKRGQLAAAADAFKKALAMEPGHGLTNNYIAQVYLRQRQFTLASEHAARAAKAGAPLSETDRKQIDAGLAAKKPGVRE
ncbi:MAG: tetratricopeptide repeat protein [Gemmatimonadaceae bacterium]